MRRLPAMLALAALAVTAGCSSPDATSTADAAPSPAASAKPAPAVLKFGQPATGKGEAGKTLQFTPLGVVYTKGGTGDHSASNGLFVIISVKVEAQDGPDHVPAPITQTGWQWRGGEESFFEASGTTPPWNGEVNQFTVLHDFAPGDPEVAYVTFDVPARGGTLVYVSPDGGRARWAIPKTQGGKGLPQILRFLKARGLTS